MLNDLIIQSLGLIDDFTSVLRIGMAIADISAKQLSAESEVKLYVVYYLLRPGHHEVPNTIKAALLEALERWRPGTLRSLYAAITAYVPLLREKEVRAL